MEDAKKIDITKGTNERVMSDEGHIPSCPFWIFGDKNSANNDLKDKFEITE